MVVPGPAPGAPGGGGGRGARLDGEGAEGCADGAFGFFGGACGDEELEEDGRAGRALDFEFEGEWCGRGLGGVRRAPREGPGKGEEGEEGGEPAHRGLPFGGLTVRGRWWPGRSRGTNRRRRASGG